MTCTTGSVTRTQSHKREKQPLVNTTAESFGFSCQHWQICALEFGGSAETLRGGSADVLEPR